MYAWQSIPIIIVNRNRLAALKSLIEWATRLGCLDVRIIDSASDYPPLLSFYESLPKNVSLLRLPKNEGPWAFWERGIHTTIRSPYIVTDADLVPSEFCPDDLIPRLLALLTRYPDCGKVGPGLRIDNLPDCYGQASIAYRWETQFWHRPLARGLFSAPIDTTFALYPEGAEFNRSPKNIRVGHPYLFDHTPWYVDEESLGEEELHYRHRTDQKFSNWSTGQAESRIAKKGYVKDFDGRKKILHISDHGVGIPGWTNLTLGGRLPDMGIGADMLGPKRLPLESDSIDGFYALDLFRHEPNPHALMQDLYRVGKSGATLHARLRSAGDAGAAQMPCFKSLFQCFSQPAVWQGKFSYLADWRVEDVTAITNVELNSAEITATQLVDLTSRNLVREVIVELSAVKPSRPRLWGSPRRSATARATSDERYLPSFCR